MPRVGTHDGWMVRVRLDLGHKPLGGSVAMTYDTGSEVVWPFEMGPFDDLEDLIYTLAEALDKQLTLW